MLALVLACVPLVGVPSSPPAFVSAAVTSDSAEIALGDSFGRVWIVDLECEEAKLAFETRDSISTLQWSRDGRRVIAGPPNEPWPELENDVYAHTLGAWRVWRRDLGNVKELRERTRAASISWSASADLELLATFGSEPVLRVWHVATESVIAELRCREGAQFRCAAWLPDARTLVAGASSGELITWEGGPAVQRFDFESGARFPCSIACANDGVHVLVGLQASNPWMSKHDGAVSVQAAWIDLDRGLVERMFTSTCDMLGMDQDGAWDVAVDPKNERCVIATGGWGSVECFRIADGTSLWLDDLRGGNAVRLRAHFSPTGSRIATHGMGSRKPTIHDAESGAKVLRPYGESPSHKRDGVLWTHDERFLITRDWDARVAHGKTGERLFDMRCTAKGIQFLR